MLQRLFQHGLLSAPSGFVGSALRILLPLILAASTLSAQSAEEREAERSVARFKAAVVFNFFEFAEWPAETFEKDNSPIRIAFLGEGLIAEEFQKATADRKAQNRSIQTIRLQYPQPEPGQDEPSAERLAALHDVLKKCHAVFILPDHSVHDAKICAALAGSPALVFSDSPGFTGLGGMIELTLHPQTRRIQFIVNLAVLEKSPTGLSSKLLRLARTVRVPPPSGTAKGGAQ